MEISAFVLRVLVLLMPGVVSALLFEKLTIHRPWTNFRFLIYTFLFGATVYLVLSIASFSFDYLCDLNGYESQWRIAFWDALLNESKRVSFLEVGLSMLIAVPIAFAASAGASRNLVNRFGVKLRTTRKYGDEPLYYAELASLGKPLLRVWTEQGLVYEGEIRSLSKESGFNELALEDVIVCDRRLVELYRLKMVFFSFEESNVVIEVVSPRHPVVAASGVDDDDQRN